MRTLKLTVAFSVGILAASLNAQQGGIATGRTGGDAGDQSKIAATQSTPTAPVRHWYSRPRRRTSPTITQPQPQPASTSAAQQARQRQLDAQVLHRQQTDSQLQQQLQDHQLQELNKQRQAQQNGPRIQEAPTMGSTGAVPGTPPQPVPETNQGPERIHDTPRPPPASTPLPAVAPTSQQ